MDIKKITLLIVIFLAIPKSSISFVLTYEALPTLLESSPLLKPYSYKAKEIEAKIKSLYTENSWWISLSGSYYFNRDYSKEIIGYNASLTAELTKNLTGYTTDILYKKFLLELNFIKNNLSKDERYTKLLWKLRFLFIEYLLLNKKIKNLEKIETTIEQIIIPQKEKLAAGLVKTDDLVVYTDLLFKIKFEQNIYKQKREITKQLISLLLGAEISQISPDEIWQQLPITIPHKENPSILMQAADELINLSKRRFYPRIKFSLGATKTWDDSSGGTWTGFSLSFPLNYKEAEKNKKREILSLWERIKEEESSRKQIMEQKALEHIAALWDLLLMQKMTARKIEHLLLDCENPNQTIIRKNTYKLKTLLLLNEYYDNQIKMFSLISSLSSTLLLKDLPNTQNKILFGCPPRNLSSWWWRSEPNQEKIAKIVEEFPILNKIYFSLNSEQIKKYIEGQNKELSFFILSLYERGIDTEILLGDPHWIFPEERQKLYQTISLIENKLYPLIQTIHLDIEPWSLPEFTEKKELLWQHYIEMLQRLRLITKLNIIIDVSPRVFKERITWNNEDKTIIDHISTYINGVVVMNYTGNTKNLLKNAKKYATLLDEKKIPYWIGISVERDESPDISLKLLNRERLDFFIHNCLRKISNSYYFRGIAIQSMEDLERYVSH
ncbi:TolC family protein [Thermodesulfatator atlanticus]|uniref:TolC family protein n=1 Tax=Thermodesulfatator atlanticus TaxID=501497 RepID=UPI0003B5CE8F|nr:TolC family protein [Thermodesulfatator atlanticus]